MSGNNLNKGEQEPNQHSDSFSWFKSLFSHQASPQKNKEIISEYQDELSKDKNQTKDKVEDKKSGHWVAPRILEADFLKEEIGTFVGWEKNVFFILWSVVFVFYIISILYVGLDFWATNKIFAVENLKTEVGILEQQTQKNEEKIEVVDMFNKRLSQIEPLLDKHIYWTNFFNFLEKNTLEGVYYKNFSGGIDGEYSLQAHTNKGYAHIANQLKLLQENKNVEQVVISNIKQTSTRDGDISFSFNLDLKVNPDIFYNND